MTVGRLLATVTITTVQSPQLVIATPFVLSSIQTDNEDSVAHALKLSTSPDNGSTFALITRFANAQSGGSQVPLDIYLPNLWLSMTSAIGSVGLVVNIYGIM